MIGTHQTDTWLASLDVTLPDQVAGAAGEQSLSKSALLGAIRTQLLPYITYGPTYRRAVADNLARALSAFRRERGEDALFWLNDAITAATAA